MAVRCLKFINVIRTVQTCKKGSRIHDALYNSLRSKRNQASLQAAPRIGKARLKATATRGETSCQLRRHQLKPRPSPSLPVAANLPSSSHSVIAEKKLTIDRYTSRNPPFYQAQQLKGAPTMSRRVLTIGGLVIVGGAGYYLYSAGGDPKVAQKNFEGM
jgi:hypothetical protein